MTPEQKAIRAKVPPRAIYVVVFECGATSCQRSRAGAELTRMNMFGNCCSIAAKCGARIVRYDRGSLYGRGAATWKMPAAQRQRPDGESK